MWLVPVGRCCVKYFIIVSAVMVRMVVVCMTVVVSAAEYFWYGNSSWEVWKICNGEMGQIIYLHFMKCCPRRGSSCCGSEVCTMVAECTQQRRAPMNWNYGPGKKKATNSIHRNLGLQHYLFLQQLVSFFLIMIGPIRANQGSNPILEIFASVYKHD